jgi:tetrapyrrole methylase family protein/MazG family protein
VRTSKHPAVDDLVREGVSIRSLDNLYEAAGSFEEVYSRIASLLLDTAAGNADIVYAVPGHPLVGEESVRIILREASARGIATRLVGSASFIESALEALGVSLSEGIKVLDALSLGEVRPDPDVGNLIYQVYDRLIASEVKLRLMERYPDEHPVRLVIASGTAEQRVLEMPLYQLDRHDVDHLTTLYVPGETLGDRL